MPEVQLHDGLFRIESNNLYATVGRGAVDCGVPVFARHMLIPPFLQTWRVARVSESLPGHYTITPEIDPRAHTVECESKVFTNHVPQEAWTLVPTPAGFVIRSQKGLIWGRPIPNRQIELVEATEPDWGWHFEQVL